MLIKTKVLVKTQNHGILAKSRHLPNFRVSVIFYCP